MATFDEIMAIAKRADEAGRTADAQALVDMARKMLPTQPESGKSVANSPQPSAAAKTWLITAPDGRQFKVSGENQAGALAALQKMFSGPEAGQASGAPPVNLDAIAQEAQQRKRSASSYAGLMAAAREAYKYGDTNKARELAKQALAIRDGSPATQAKGSASPSMVGGMSGAATDGALFGFGDEYLAGLSAALGVQPDGNGGANWFDYSRPIGDRYNTALDAIRKEQGQFQAAHPGASMGAEIAGSLIGPGKGAGAFVNGATKTSGRIARGIVAGGAAGGLYGFGEGEGGTTARASSALTGGVIGAASGGLLTGLGEGIARAIPKIANSPSAKNVVPTLEAMREKAGQLYEAAKESGGVVNEGRMKLLVGQVSQTLRNEGFDPQLHPRIAATLTRLQNEAGPKSLADMEILRRVASNAAASLQPDERRLAGKVIDHIDNTVARLSGSEGLAEARKVWAQIRRLETVETAIEKASLTDDFARGLRTQFKALLRNPKRLRGFSGAELKAIAAVAKGAPLEHTLRGLGKLMAPTGISGAALTGGAAFGGAGLGAAAIPLVGMTAKSAANAMTKASAQQARDFIASGVARTAPRNALAATTVIPGTMAQ
ncbi:hypothetical protein BMG00_11185 [Thioclava marina]|uniref:Uncharacterized protein n=1 Tax=Thioclava marina TaxID=1915077 RepID=A0ABX3MN96_9RHOB|nr:hypothetical protein [Thioclava marina]OOY11659.1 hypothetical protein BMG00_11185 [Thioclava marina]